MPTNPGTTGLVAWWALDEASGNRADSHAGGYTLTDVNTVTSGAGIGGSGTAAEFLAANSESLTTTDATVRAATASGADWTLGLWIYPTIDTGLAEPIGTYHTAGILCRRRGLTSFGSSEVAWDYFTDAGSPTRREGGAATPINTWSFIALKFDTTANLLYAYTNGTATTGTSFTGTASATATFRVGARGSASGATFWTGRVARPFLYSRVLSTDELDWLYNSGAGRTYADLTGGSAASIVAQMHHHHAVFGG